MIKITITSTKADASFVEDHPEFIVGDQAYYIIRESGKRISQYYRFELNAVLRAWQLVIEYGLTLVEPW